MIYLSEEDFKIARANGISWMNAYNRVYNCGWSVEDAIHTPVRTKEDHLWPKWRELAESNGITQATFRSRIKKQGMTEEQAATRPIMSAREASLQRKNPKITMEMVKRAEAIGINRRTLESRVYVLRWDVEKAITTPIIPKTRRKG